MKREIMIILLVALAVAAFVSPFAASSPDGLERVAEDHEFIEKAEGQEVFQAPMPDYGIPSLADSVFSGSVAGIIGTILTFVLMLGLAKTLTTGKKV
ncbi:MAG: PDGLE domain-containing protein [Heliobacteriaceae bacterium]|nr:PDGLE domain-containing protein [Heliobacteriaceae bacterium]MDD4588544.1 PDGLE domain-containing protein [Heliobacteriaceae bacterium]